MGTSVYKDWIPNDIYLPAFSITAEEIFADEIHLFDVNFFNPKNQKETSVPKLNPSTEKIVTTNLYWNLLAPYAEPWEPAEEDRYKGQRWEGTASWVYYYTPYLKYVDDRSNWTPCAEEEIEYFGSKYDKIGILPGDYANLKDLYKMCMEDTEEYANKAQMQSLLNKLNIPENAISNDYKIQKSWTIYDDRTNVFVYDDENDIYYYYGGHGGTKISVIDSNNQVIASLEEEWAIRRKENDDPEEDEEEVEYGYARNETIMKAEIGEDTLVVKSTAEQLKRVVSTWYFILRNIALIVLMLILIFIGIKIVIGSTAGEKAKYKERLMDWFVAVCLIFIMHYIMAFSVQLVESITALVRNGNTNRKYCIYCTK